MRPTQLPSRVIFEGGEIEGPKTMGRIKNGVRIGWEGCQSRRDEWEKCKRKDERRKGRKERKKARGSNKVLKY